MTLPVSGQRASSAPSDASSVKSRVLMRLGFLPLTKRTDDRPERFSYAAASLMPSRGVPVQVGNDRTPSPAHDGQHPGKSLEEAIRAALPTLPHAEAERYRRLLDNTLRAGDPARKAILLRMLDANVRAAVARHDATQPQAGVWQALAKTSVNVQFQGDVASMSKAKEEQLLRLRLDILKLPAELATGYQTLLRDILASKGAARRDALLTRMARQVAARAAPDRKS